jgi:hypothetical protein
LLTRQTFLKPCLILHLANEYAGDHRPAFGALLRRMGKVPGAFDYLVWARDGGLFLEFKSSKGKLSPNQQAFGEELSRIGIDWHVVRSCEEAIGVLRERGIVR